jgi:tRNA threonylcarbamoyladenosine biosynthesis protein TsaE
MFTSDSAEATAAFGADAARRTQAGDVFALVGDLGAGKTQFVKGFVGATGSDAVVTSPTFTLVHEYGGGRLPVYHFDFYRLDTPEAVLAIGFDDYVYGDGVCLIEWADRFPELLPAHSGWFVFRVAGETVRTIESRDAS